MKKNPGPAVAIALGLPSLFYILVDFGTVHHWVKLTLCILLGMIVLFGVYQMTNESVKKGDKLE